MIRCLADVFEEVQVSAQVSHQKEIRRTKKLYHHISYEGT